MGANTTGEYNAAVGKSCMASNTTGNHNVAVGRNAMNANTLQALEILQLVAMHMTPQIQKMITLQLVMMQ